jgi:hypothetical protein
VNKPTFYEQVGIIIPGAVFLVGLLFYFPPLNALMAKEGVTLGQFGIFLLLSYAGGHFVAAIGNLLEAILWRLFGGMPSDWITKPGCPFLSPQQVTAIETKATIRLNMAVGTLQGMDRKAWRPVSRQVYADVNKHGKADRIDTFNGNYGLNRGLSAACLGLAFVAAIELQWHVVAGFVVLAAVFAYRAYRFAVHYARELYLQFLVLTATTDVPKGVTTKLSDDAPHT